MNNLKLGSFAYTPSYDHILLQSNSGLEVPPDLQRDFEHMFVGGRLPNIGDEVRMVCTARIEEGSSHSIVINLEVVDRAAK